MRAYPYYTVARRIFPDYRTAHLFAAQYTATTAQRVALMETLDAFTPAHVLSYYQKGAITKS